MVRISVYYFIYDLYLVLMSYSWGRISVYYFIYGLYLVLMSSNHGRISVYYFIYDLYLVLISSNRGRICLERKILFAVKSEACGDTDNSDQQLNSFRVVCPNFGQPAITSLFTKCKFLQVKNSFATIVNKL